MNTLTQSILNNEPQSLLTVSHPPYIDLRHKNVEVNKVYTNIIKEMRHLLSRMSTKENRTYLLTNYEVKEKYTDNVLFEFVCVMCTLTLSVKEYSYYIELEADSDIEKVIGGYNYHKMLRAAYRATMYEFTQHDLEDRLSVYTNMQDHYSYFKNRLKDKSNPDTLIVTEETIAS
jgi:hypothetical protein